MTSDETLREARYLAGQELDRFVRMANQTSIPGHRGNPFNGTRCDDPNCGGCFVDKMGERADELLNKDLTPEESHSLEVWQAVAVELYRIADVCMRLALQDNRGDSEQAAYHHGSVAGAVRARADQILHKFPSPLGGLLEEDWFE